MPESRKDPAVTPKAFIRKLNGKPVIFIRAITADKVEVRFEDRVMTFSNYEWKKLPFWHGPLPT
jgi:hypothetical protein